MTHPATMETALLVHTQSQPQQSSQHQLAVTDAPNCHADRVQQTVAILCRYNRIGLKTVYRHTQSHTHMYALSLSLSFTHKHTHTHRLTHSHSLSRSHSHTYIYAQTNSLSSLSLSTLSLSLLSLTHTHTCIRAWGR